MLTSGLEGERRVFLIMDPAGELHNLVRALLTPVASRIMVAGDINHSLALARTERPDVIIAACGIHGGAAGLCRRIRQEPLLNGTPFVIVTSSSDVTDYAAYLEYGCDEIVPIPFRCQQFYSAVRSALDRNQEHSLNRVQVLYKTGHTDFVERDELDRLITAKELVCFRRQDGIAMIGRDPVRRMNLDDGYSGHDRRRA